MTEHRTFTEAELTDFNAFLAKRVPAATMAKYERLAEEKRRAAQLAAEQERARVEAERAELARRCAAADWTNEAMHLELLPDTWDALFSPRAMAYLRHAYVHAPDVPDPTAPGELTVAEISLDGWANEEVLNPLLLPIYETLVAEDPAAAEQVRLAFARWASEWFDTDAWDELEDERQRVLTAAPAKAAKVATDHRTRILAYLGTVDGAVSRNKLFKEIKGNKQAFTAALDAMVEAGELVEEQGAHGAKLVRLAD